MDVETLARFIAICSAHRLFVDALTAAVAIVLGLVTLFLGRQTLRQERWVAYFGTAFLILAVQYFFPSISGLGRLLGFWPSAFEGKHLEWFLRFCSAANNVFFLAAGSALWRPEWKQRRRYWFASTFVALVAVLIDWADWFHPWHRVPEGLLSAFAACVLGIGFFFNASPRRRWRFAAIATFGALLYALLSLAVIFAPAFAEGKFSGRLSAGISVALGAAAGQAPPERLLYALDSFLITLALPLKFLLAGGAFVLIIRALVLLNPRVWAEVIEGVTRGDLDYFGSEGVVRVIGVSLRANRTSVSFRLPGLSEPRIGWVEWPVRLDASLVRDLPPTDDGREGQVLATGHTVVNPNWGGQAGWLAWWRAGRRSTGRSLITAPVLYQGTVIGCLTVEWEHAHAYTETGVHVVERLAETLAVPIESRRRLEALAYWGRRLQGLKLETVPTPYKNLAAILARFLHETLSPLAVGLALEAGFSPVWAVSGDRGTRSGFRNDLQSGGLDFELRGLAGSVSNRLDRIAIRFGDTSMGSLVILWPDIQKRPHPLLARPLVRSDRLHLLSLVPPVANAVVRSSEASFFHILNDLQIVLLTVRRREEWLATVESASIGAGLIWVIAEQANGEVLGNGPHEVVREVVVDASDQFWHRRVKVPRAGAHHLVRLALPASGGKLWLGASNPELGPELEATWPWRNFLERLAGAADAALAGLTTKLLLDQARQEAGQIQGLLQSTVDTGAFIHEMRNIARNFRLAAQSLGEAKRRGKIQASIDIDRDIEDMQKSAERLYVLADNVLTPSALDGRSVYPLVDLAQEVRVLFGPILSAHRIDLLIDVSSELEVATPSYAVHLALVSLVSNSVDAVPPGGTIRIVGVLAAGSILCHVTDNGPGIGLEDPQTVFDLGTSTKVGTGGKGLFMIRKLLEGVGANVVLTSPEKGETTFTLCLQAAPGKD